MTSPIPENGCIFMGGWDILDLDRPKGCPLDKTSPFKPVPGDVTLRRKAKGKVFSPRKEEQTAEKHCICQSDVFLFFLCLRKILRVGTSGWLTMNQTPVH